MAVLSRGQRAVVRLAGPLAQALVLGLLWLLTGDQAPAWLRDHPWAIQLVMNGLYQLGLINLAWLVLNVLPIWPLDGGYLLRDLCEAIFGARGTAIALGVCMGVPIVLASWIAQEAQLPLLYDPRGGVQVQMCGILLIFCILLFLSAFRALREDYRQWRAQETASRQSRGDVSR
jgi:Zn-dependent protease